MNVVFDEEQRVFDKDREIAATRNQNAQMGASYKKMSIWQNVMMIFFALLCLGVGALIWLSRPTLEPIAPMYREEANNETLRLIPEKDREEFMRSLPVIQKK